MRYPESPYFCASPYYFPATPYFPPKHKPRLRLPKPDLWKCRYCGCANLDKSIKCEHCNGPRHVMEHKQKAALWQMDTPSIRVEYTERKRLSLVDRLAIDWRSFCNWIVGLSNRKVL